MSSYTALDNRPKHWQGLWLLVLSLWSLPAAAEWVEWILDPDMSVRYHDNLNNSSFSADKESDTSTHTQVQVGRFNQLTSTLRLRASADLSYQGFDQFDELNGWTLAANLGLRYKFGVGPRRPWMLLSGRVAETELEASSWDTRSWIGQLSVGARLTERFDYALTLQYIDQDQMQATPREVASIHSNVFDQQRLSLTARGNFLLSPHWIASAALEYWDGEFDSSCTAENVPIVLLDEDGNINALMPNTVFGGCIYNLNGDGFSVLVDVGYAINGHTAVNLGYQRFAGEADLLSYDSNQYSVSLNYSY